MHMLLLLLLCLFCYVLLECFVKRSMEQNLIGITYPYIDSFFCELDQISVLDISVPRLIPLLLGILHTITCIWNEISAVLRVSLYISRLFPMYVIGSKRFNSSDPG